MKSKSATLTVLLLGIGCSHAAPKTEVPATTLASLAHPAPSPSASRPSEEYVEAPAPARKDSAENAIFFDFDSAALREDARPTLQQVGRDLVRGKESIRIEGNCDERGTTEFNIALGDRRAREAKSYLERLGVPGKRISVVSYGSERPKVSGHDEAAYAQNRRDDLVVR